MAVAASPDSLAGQARRIYTEKLVKGLTQVVQSTLDQARGLLDKPTEHVTMMRRRELLQALNKGAQGWHRCMVAGLRRVLTQGSIATRSNDLPPPGSRLALTLVPDDTIELEIVTSRLALAVMDRASWEFADLRSRMAHLEGRTELEPHDMLRAHMLARIVFDAWRGAGLDLEGWRELQGTLHDEVAALVEEAYHETNRWLVEHKVLPEVDLRPFIRRSRSHPGAQLGGGWGDSFADDGDGSVPPGLQAEYASSAGFPAPERAPGDWADSGGGRAGDDGAMVTRAAPLARSREHAETLLGRLNRLVSRQVTEFAPNSLGAGLDRPASAMSPGLAQAMDSAERGIHQRVWPATQQGVPVATTPLLLDELQRRKQALKIAADTPEERATIEIVALLFQSILAEDRIPPAIRVWFARLQMPVLRVAVIEPDFFAAIDHPARRLIDRMGACVMGFDSAAGVNESLEREIKRIVQVVEAYPDTGRRVFQTVLVEFEKFLEHYFKNENELTKRGVSLAQQVEQRETLAIQYTIELRRMLNEVPVQDGVRQFLFQVWADVLATSGMRHGAQGEQTKAMKRAAADLIWSASAKVTREERADVIRRLPLLLKSLREGMAAAGLDQAGQDVQIQLLNNSLAAAFTAKAAAISDDRLRDLMDQLETLEELLPDATHVDIDESMVLDLSGHQISGLEVVLDGGSPPTPAMVAWARELQVGSWYLFDRGGHTETVQLSWHGLRKQLSLFVTPKGRCVLFQQHRLASYLQGGLIVPAQDESLTVRATRSALANLDFDASRLMS
jgi:hypothetical protein